MKYLICFLLIFTLPTFAQLPIKFPIDKTIELKNNNFLKKIIIKGEIIAYLPDDFSDGIIEVEPFTLESWVTWFDDTEFDLSLSAAPIIYYDGTDICDLVLTDFVLGVSEVTSETFPTKWLLKKIVKMARKFDEGKFLPEKKVELIELGNTEFKKFIEETCSED